MYGAGQRAGRRAVVVGAEHVSYSAVHTLSASGAEVAAMVTDLPRHQTYGVLAWLAAGRHRIPLLTGCDITRVSGKGRVDGVDFVHRPTGATRSIACDTVVFTGDWIPDHELARAGGLTMDAGTRGPRVDPSHRTSSPGVFAAGNLADGAGWDRAVVPVDVAAPLVWIVPSALAPGNGASIAPRFVLRVGAFLPGATIEVRQGPRLLHRERFRALVPNRSIRLRGEWASAVGPEAGTVRVAIAGGGESGGGTR